jgi:hypothetical protein
MMNAKAHIEKRLFPRLSPANRRRYFNFLLLAIFLGMIVSAIFGTLLYWLNQQGRF